MTQTATTQPTLAAPAQRGVFHDLEVAAVDRLTDKAVAVTVKVPDELSTAYTYQAGQHLTIRHRCPDQAIRRSYSICLPPPNDGRPKALRIAVKQLGSGGFSQHALTGLAPGNRLEVMVPAGRFRLIREPGAHHILIAAGSGITPVLAIAATALRDDPSCRVSLLYGNRTASSIMFLDDLADLKDSHPDRFTLLHVLSRESRGIPLLHGRIDTEGLPRLLHAISALQGEEQYYLCGPLGLAETARKLLAEHGIERLRIHFELFDAGDSAAPRPPSPVASQDSKSIPITVCLGGRTTECTMEPTDASVLDAVLRSRPDAPYSCTSGVCGTCRAKLIAGEVEMDRDYALEPEEKIEGFVLPCRSRPRLGSGSRLALDFDA